MMGCIPSSSSKRNNIYIPESEATNNEHVGIASHQMRGGAPKTTDKNSSKGNNKKGKKKNNKKTAHSTKQYPKTHELDIQPEITDVTSLTENERLKDQIEKLESDREVRQQNLNKLNTKLRSAEGKLEDATQTMAKLDKENQKLLHSHEELKTSNVGLIEEVKNLSTENQKAKQSISDLETKMNDTSKKSKHKAMAEQAKLIQEMDTKINRLETEKQELQKKHDDNLTNVASLMNQKMARDESDLENINARNRPMIVMEEYNMFCSQEWLEAKSALDEWVENQNFEVQEKMLFEILTDAMFKCYDFCETLLGVLMEHFEIVLDNPLQLEILQHPDLLYVRTKKRHEALVRISKITGKPDKRTELDQDFKVMIGKAFKETSNTINFKTMAEDFAKMFLETKHGSDIDATCAENPSIQEYFAKCLLISWKMVIQQPPMKFICEPPVENKYDELKHELHYGSADPKNPISFISVYIHPALYHGEKQMKKARVLLALEIVSDKSDTCGRHKSDPYDNNIQVNKLKTVHPDIPDVGPADNVDIGNNIRPIQPSQSTHAKSHNIEINPSGSCISTAQGVSPEAATGMFAPNPSSTLPTPAKQNQKARENRRSQGITADPDPITAYPKLAKAPQRLNSVSCGTTL